MVEEAPETPKVVSAKEEILNRIGSALEVERPHRESDYAYIPRQYRMKGQLDEAARVELFIDRLHDYGASVFECTENLISEAVATALRERNVQQVITGADFPGSWIPTGFDFRGDHHLELAEIDQFGGVVTACALAIAETGTLVLRHADEEPRRAVSLIPDYHLCIVFRDQIVETVPQGVREMAAMGGAPLTTISGPSATSDIEMTRIKGVHGPRDLDVVIVAG